MIVNAVIDLEMLGMSIDEWDTFSKEKGISWDEHVPEPTYSNHIRNLIGGWEYMGRISDFTISDTEGVRSMPGLYALTYDPDGEITHPLNYAKTIKFGETTQPYWKRMAHHATAITGGISNVSDKWNSSKSHIANKLGIKSYQLNGHSISIYFRPHAVSDPYWQCHRFHSSLMETQAHAIYKVIHKRFAPGNSRDLPSIYLVEKAEKFVRDYRLNNS